MTGGGSDNGRQAIVTRGVHFCRCRVSLTSMFTYVLLTYPAAAFEVIPHSCDDIMMLQRGQVGGVEMEIYTDRRRGN